MSNMETYEVAAIGDLYKKNLSGRKTWNLREFALTGVHLIYYKKGEKRGEWDISGCKVRKITAEEAQQPAAKFAFAIEGNKRQYMLSANNEKNRELWIAVLEKQILEFRNPVRRFIRTGEVVHANGFVKRKNLFGKTPMLLVVTNFPRIIEIDPATIELKDQYTWKPNETPKFTKSGEKFNIQVSGKTLKFEDPANGMPYWENVFKIIPKMELWSPSKQPTLRIGFPEKSKKTVAKPQSSKDIQFLEEALATIQELLNTLNARIEDIDMIFVLAVQYGQETSEEVAAKSNARQLKRSQLVLLKENIDIISDNLKALIQRSKQKGTALFDVAAIESVIAEAASLLILLNTEDEDDGIDDGGVFVAEVNEIDQIVAKVEEETTQIPAERMRSATITRAGLSADPVTELDINANTFDPANPSKRPEGWTNILMLRVLKKEQADREAGMDEDSIMALRANREAEEDALMCAEVAKHGKVLGLKAGGRGRSATLQQDSSLLDINSDNFDAPYPNKRPSFWAEVRTKRVMLKEHIERINGTPEAVISDQRATREIDEEMILVGEVLVYDRIVNIGETKIAYQERATFNGFNASGAARPTGWDKILKQRVMLKELEDRLNGEDESVISSRKAARLQEEDADMVKEMNEDGSVLKLGKRTAHKKTEVASQAMTQTIEEAMVETVVIEEVSQIPESVSSGYEIEEPVQYADEPIAFGSISLNDTAEERMSMVRKASVAAPVETRGRTASLEITKADIKNYMTLTTTTERPLGWADIKLRRVYLKEWEDRRNGVDEEEILEKRYQRELEAEQEMIAELGVKGKIELFEKGIKRPVRKVAQERAMREFALFLEASNASLENIKSNASKLSAA